MAGAGRQPSVLRFGACELHKLRRELKVDGTVRTLPPKAFKLLLLLLEHRDRVVSKQEIVDHLWHGLVLTESVLARTIMKARRGIGDAGSGPTGIRSMHGVGYRFVGDVFVDAVADPPPAQPAAPSRPGVRIAVLPCRNASGDADLDWVQIGLMALVTHALDGDARLAPVPAMVVLEALPRSTGHLPVAEQVGLAVDALGVSHVVYATAYRQGKSMWLDYSVQGRGVPPVLGSLRDHDAVALCQRLAVAVEEAIFPGQGATVRLVSDDTFVNQAFARGMELYAQEEWREAEPLFAVVCAAEPDSMVALRWRLQCLATLRDPAALGLGKQLLQCAVDAGDIKYQAIAHVWLALAWMHQRVPQAIDASRAHGGGALQLAEGREHEEWVIWHRVHIAMHAVFSDRGAHVQRLLAEAEDGCRSTGNTYALSQVQRLLAIIDLCSGDLLRARGRLEEAQHIHRRLRHRRSITRTSGLLGLANASLGLLDAAFAQCDETLEVLSDMQRVSWDGLVLSAIARVYAERGAAEPIRRVHATLEALSDANHPQARGPLLAVRGCLALCLGDAAAARASLQAAVELRSAGLGAFWARIWLMLLLRLEVAAGDAAAAQAVCRQLTELPTASRDVEVKAIVLHAGAAEQHRAGHLTGALDLLGQIIEEVPLGYEHACARLDAAWLSLEAGDVEHAEQWLTSVTPWLEGHPVGLATQARLHFARREPAAAAATQRRAIDRYLGRVPDWHREALQTYEAAGAGHAACLPALPRLASDSWLMPGRESPASGGTVPRDERMAAVP